MRDYELLLGSTDMAKMIQLEEIHHTLSYSQLME